MANDFRDSQSFRMANNLMTALLRLGLPIGGNVLLTVPGRKSGVPRTTTVTLLERDGQRWVQSPFGDVDWVRNLRASGRATLTRGRRTEEILAIELVARRGRPNLPVGPRLNLRYRAPSAATTRSRRNRPLAAFEAEARRHPMFRIVSAR